MAPVFIMRKAEQKEVHEDDLSEFEDVDGLLIPRGPTRERKKRSFFDRMSKVRASPVESSTGTDEQEPHQSGADTIPNGKVNLLTAFNTLFLPSDRTSHENDDFLKPLATRPRASSAPSRPREMDRNSLSSAFTSAMQDGGMLKGHLKEPSLTDDERWARTRALQRQPRVPLDRNEKAVTLCSASGASQTPAKSDPPASGPQSAPAKPIPMPSWPVSITAGGLLGPIPPGSILSPPPIQFPFIPSTPFQVAQRAFSVPTTIQTSTNKALMPLRPAGTPAPSSRERTPSPDSTMDNLRSAHQAHINNISEAHTKAMEALEVKHVEELEDINETHADEMAILNASFANLEEAHRIELTNLRTRMALLERQASLPQGQHLSPSGLLPLLNTSTAPASRQSLVPNTAIKNQSEDVMVATQAQTTQETSEQNSQASVNGSNMTIANLWATLSQAQTEVHGLRSANTLAKEEAQARDRSVKQMRAAMTSAAERENMLKTELADLRNRHGAEIAAIRTKLETTIEEKLDLREHVDDAKGRIRALIKAESTLRKQLDRREARRTLEDSVTDVREVERKLRQAEADREHQQLVIDAELESREHLEKTLSKAILEAKDARAELQALTQKLAAVEEAGADYVVDSMGLITIANALQEGNEVSPAHTDNSPIGRMSLLQRELRNLHYDERSQLISYMERLDERQSSNASAQTDKSTDSTASDRARRYKALVLKLEGERERLSSLLAVEIRRSARSSASADVGNARLERYDSIRSRVGSLASTRPSPTSTEDGLHADCTARFNRVCELYDEEMLGLVKEIVLYKLDVKGYKKDLKLAKTTITKLQTGATFEDVITPEASPAHLDSISTMSALDSVKGDIPEPLRTRRSTTHLMNEKKPSRGSESRSRGTLPRATSVDGLGITALSGQNTPLISGSKRPSHKTSQQSLASSQFSPAMTTPRRPGMHGRAMTVETSSPATSRGASEKLRLLGRKDSVAGCARGVDDLGLSQRADVGTAAALAAALAGACAGVGAAPGRMVLTVPRWDGGDAAGNETAAGGVGKLAVPLSYGKDRLSPLSDAELGEDDLRPLSTVAEVGSTCGASPS